MPVLWENDVFGLIPKQEWLDVGTQVTRPTDPLDSLIDDVRTDNMIVSWQTIASEYNTPVMAYFHAFDTEAERTVRIPVDTHNIKKGLIKVKLNQSELLQEYADNGLRDDALKDRVLNDGIRLADQVVTRSKVAKAELLARGVVTVRENNLDMTVNYGIPAAHTALELDLSPDADIGGQIQGFVDQAADAGVTLTGFITARKNITKMRQNTSIQKALGGNLNVGALVSRAALEAHLEEEYGLSRIITHDLTYGAKATMGADGRPVIDKKRYFPDNKVTFFSTNPAGKLASGLWGDPPEVRLEGLYPVNGSAASPFVYVTQKMEWDPAVLWTKASGLFMPVLFDPNSLWIATVKTTP